MNGHFQTLRAGYVGVGGHELQNSIILSGQGFLCTGVAAGGVIRGLGLSCSVITVRTTVRARWGGGAGNSLG